MNKITKHPFLRYEIIDRFAVVSKTIIRISAIEREQLKKLKNYPKKINAG